MGPNSDIDLLVVKSGDYHRGALTDEIYMNLFGGIRPAPGRRSKGSTSKTCASVHSRRPRR
jgi:hypothetical protein